VERSCEAPFYDMFLSSANDSRWIPNILTVAKVTKGRYEACLDCVDIESMISQLFSLIEANSEARVCARCLESISRLAVLGM